MFLLPGFSGHPGVPEFTRKVSGRTARILTCEGSCSDAAPAITKLAATRGDLLAHQRLRHLSQLLCLPSRAAGSMLGVPGMRSHTKSDVCAFPRSVMPIVRSSRPTTIKPTVGPQKPIHLHHYRKIYHVSLSGRRVPEMFSKHWCLFHGRARTNARTFSQLVYSNLKRRVSACRGATRDKQRLILQHLWKDRTSLHCRLLLPGLRRL